VSGIGYIVLLIIEYKKDSFFSYKPSISLNYRINPGTFMPYYYGKF